MRTETTSRGFGIIQFQDRNGVVCSLQESSVATESCVWFGCDDADPMTFVPHGNPAWRPLELPAPAPGGHHQFTTRMHLSQDQVRDILPALVHFAEHGTLPEPDHDIGMGRDCKAP